MLRGEFMSYHKSYNMEVTGVITIQKTEKIYRVGSLTSWEQEETITVHCDMSVAGTFFFPCTIHARHSPQLDKDRPLSAVYEYFNNV